MKKFFSNRTLVLISVFTLIVLIVFITLAFLFIRNRENNQDSASDRNLQQEQQVSEGENVHFTEDLFDVKRISNITPLGELNGGYQEFQTVGSVLLNMKVPANENDLESMEIYAPTDMTLSQYAYYQFPGEQPEWGLEFQISPTVTMRISHIERPSQAIQGVTSDTPKETSASNSPKKKLKIGAGELIAYTKGTSQAHNWNIMMLDQSQTNTFINQDRYDSNYLGNYLVNAKCPFDYYSDEMAAKYIALMGYDSAGQLDNCGQVSKDVAGTISGLWHFSEDIDDVIKMEKDGDYVTPLAVYKTSSDTIIIDNLAEKRRDIESDNSTYIDPAEITNEHCYSLFDRFNNSPDGYAYFKVISDTKMELAYSSTGNCPTSFPENIGKAYYR